MPLIVVQMGCAAAPVPPPQATAGVSVSDRQTCEAYAQAEAAAVKDRSLAGAALGEGLQGAAVGAQAGLAGLVLAPLGFLVGLVAGPVEVARENKKLRQTEYDNALKACLEPHVLASKLGPEHPEVARSLVTLASRYRDNWQYDRAELLYQRALAMQEKALGPDHPDVASTLNRYAGLLTRMHRDAEASEMDSRAQAIRQGHATEEAKKARVLANLYVSQEQYAEAEPLYQQAVSIVEQTFGPDHPAVAVTLTDYAILLRKTGRDAEASEMEARAAGIRGRSDP